MLLVLILLRMSIVGPCKPLQGGKTLLPLIAMGLTGAWAACNDEGHKGATPAPDTPRPFSAAGHAVEMRCWGHSEQSLLLPDLPSSVPAASTEGALQ